MEEFNQSIIDKWYFILCLWIRLLFKWELRFMRYWYIWLDWYSWNLKVASHELHTCCMLGQSTPWISLLMTIKASLCKSAHSIREEKHFVFYSSMTTHSRKLRLWNLKIIQTKKKLRKFRIVNYTDEECRFCLESTSPMMFYHLLGWATINILTSCHIFREKK